MLVLCFAHFSDHVTDLMLCAQELMVLQRKKCWAVSVLHAQVCNAMTLLILHSVCHTKTPTMRSNLPVEAFSCFEG